MDETFVRTAVRWFYLFRAVDNHRQTVDFSLSERRDRVAAKCFLQTALLIRTVIRCRFSRVTVCVGIRRQSGGYKRRAKFTSVAVTAPGVFGITVSNPTTDM